MSISPDQPAQPVDAADDTSLPPEMRRVGWAGLLMDCPKAFRFARVEGDARQGTLILADTERPRLELVWARVRRRRFDGHRFVLRRLRRLLGQRRIKEDQYTVVANSRYAPLWRITQEAANRDRYVGYHPDARRVIEVVYHHGGKAEDKLIRQHFETTLDDQPPTRPQRWAFFDVSFIAPAGFVYESSRLNLGDMRVRLMAGKRLWTGPRLTVGQIYPARLALKRQPMDQWLHMLCGEVASHYRPLAGRSLTFTHDHTPQGDEHWQTEMILRRRFRPWLWRTPRRLRMSLLHQPAVDRLTFLNVTDHSVDRMEEHARFLHESLHWAGLAG